MKKVFLVILSTFLLLSLMSCKGETATPDTSSTIVSEITSETETSAENTLRYVVLENGTIRVEDGSVYFPLEDGTLAFAFDGEAVDVVIPSEFNGKTVTELKEEAFAAAKKTLRSVTLPDSIRDIGGEAFRGCELLSQVNIPESVVYISELAFAECTSLKQIRIPGGVNFGLSRSTFYNSGLETVTLCEGLKTIPSSAFNGTNLKEVILPSSIKEIGASAFGNCHYLEKIFLGDNLRRIEWNAFVNDERLEEIIIPPFVWKIVDFAFEGCIALKRIYFEGDAPNDYLSYYGSTGLSYTILYHEEATGFTSPEWCGHPTAIW